MGIRISRRTVIILFVAVVVLAVGWRLAVGRGQPGVARFVDSQTASPTTRAGSVAASSSPTLSSSPSALPSPVPCAPTDQDQYVYNPARLQVIAGCLRLTGVVAEIRTEADGDLHILLDLDAPFAHLLTPANQGVERGDMVVEPVCVRSVSQTDAVEACASDPDPMTALPQAGAHVWMEGRYVLDLEHDSWAELHPLYRWGLQPAQPQPGASPTPIGSSAAGCDPAYPTVCIPPPPPDLDCADIPYRRFTVLPPDPHHFDGDHDGIGCES
ncbi:MAG: hypothetical protein M3O78_04755 [Chloroflexota bacterium]|nr:hypothetical protein [Chloroflexota bacterium]